MPAVQVRELTTADEVLANARLVYERKRQRDRDALARMAPPQLVIKAVEPEPVVALPEPPPVATPAELTDGLAALMQRIARLEKELWPTGAPSRYPRITTIQQAVSKFYSLTMTDLRSARRQQSVVRPRQIAMYLCRTMTLKSLPEIGRAFGGKDHTTVHHACQKIEQLRKTFVELNDDVVKIKAAIRTVNP